MIRLSALLFLMSFFGIAAHAQEKRSEKKFINPEGLSKPTGYSHVVVSGGTVYVSGQVALNDKGEVVGKGDMQAQAIRVFENLKICLAAAGIDFNDVVKVNYYVVNLKPEYVPLIREVRKNYLPATNPPASTLVSVAGLVNPDLMLEVEVVARLR
jgi:enamine deaminase RidA (YjgF/YER057c/UK114 family)